MTIATDNRSVPRTSVAVWREWQEKALKSFAIPVSVQRIDQSATSESIPAPRQDLATARINHLSALITELNNLFEGPETDGNDDLQRPTKHAYDTCCNLLIEAAIDDYHYRRESETLTTSIAIPMGLVSPDGRGGLRIEWIRDDASVHLAVPPTNEEPAYVYIEAGDDYETKDTDYALLAIALRKIY